MILTTDIKKKVSIIGLFFIFILPVFTHAQGKVDIPPEPEKVNTGITYDCANEHRDTKYGECTFEDVILAVQKVLGWARNIALFFSVIVLVIAGFRYMVSGDNPGERTKANKMFVSVIKGIFFVMAAWLIVTLITNALLAPGVSTIIQNNKPS